MLNKTDIKISEIRDVTQFGKKDFNLLQNYSFILSFILPWGEFCTQWSFLPKRSLWNNVFIEEQMMVCKVYWVCQEALWMKFVSGLDFFKASIKTKLPFCFWCYKTINFELSQLSGSYWNSQRNIIKYTRIHIYRKRL